MKEEGDAIEEPSLVAAGGGLDRTAATTESIPQMTNIEWGKAACSEDAIQECVEAGVFHPGELIEWRAPIKDETPTLSTLEDQFVILSLTHIICGLRLDASDFLVSVLNHYRIEWSHLTPNSITTLSMFAHLCEAYVAVPPTVEVFTHFYGLYQNMRGKTTTLSSVFFRLSDNMKNYPLYYLKNSQYMWVSLWFYAKVPQSCRLTFRCDALEEKNNWKDLLPLSHEQEKQVLKITELSNRGLTGADIVQDYLKHQISPLCRRTHLACDYSGPSDPTRDSDTDPSEEDIESKLSLLLDLKKMVLKQPTDRPNVPTRLVRSSASDHANQPLGLLSVFSTEEAKKNSLEEITASIKKRKSSMITYKFQVGHASLRRSTRQSAGVTKTFPKAKKFRNKSFPLFEALGELYDGHTAEGNYNFTSTQAPLHADLTQVDIENEVSVIITNLRNEGQEADASVQPTAEGETARVEAPSVQSAGVPRSDDVASRNGDEKGPKRQGKSGNIEGLMERDLDTRTKQDKDAAAQLAKEKEISRGSDFSIKRCIYVLNRLEVTKVEKAKAYGVFKNPDNREIFLSACDEDQESALIWLRNEMD